MADVQVNLGAALLKTGSTVDYFSRHFIRQDFTD
jgi:hypothetical protein